MLAVISKISLPTRLLPTRKLLRYPPEPSAPPVAPRKYKPVPELSPASSRVMKFLNLDSPLTSSL